MRDVMELGPVPYEEDCEQLGPNYDSGKARRECEAFIRQLTRLFGQPPEGVYFKVTSSRHDFGTYHEAGISYNTNSDTQCEWAYNVENNTPATWDDEARAELAAPPGWSHV